MKKCVTKYMSPCFETMLCQNGNIENLIYHQKRFDKTRQELFDSRDYISLRDVLTSPKDGIFRVRLLYDKDVLKIEYLPIITRKFSSFRLVESNMIYNYKYDKRSEIDTLRQKYNSFDDIIISDEGMLKDTSIANIALYIKGKWHTPKKPLLEGTARARLLEKKLLIASDLDIQSIKNSTKFAIMNAIIGFLPIDSPVIDEDGCTLSEIKAK